MVSRASSITAHCLGVRALASSRTMCSYNPNPTSQFMLLLFFFCDNISSVKHLNGVKALTDLQLGQLPELFGSIKDELCSLKQKCEIARDREKDRGQVDQRNKLLLARGRHRGSQRLQCHIEDSDVSDTHFHKTVLLSGFTVVKLLSPSRAVIKCIVVPRLYTAERIHTQIDNSVRREGKVSQLIVQVGEVDIRNS